MLRNQFSTTPLVTPARLRENIEEPLEIGPPWVRAVGVADPEIPLEENVASLYVGDVALSEPGEGEGPYFLPVVSVAILFELTRFANSVVPNPNKPRGHRGRRWYLRFKPASAAKDLMPVSRIIMGATQGQEVRSSEDARDLHPESLSLVGAGKPDKDARQVALRHAADAARNHAPDGYSVQTYLDNLRALFDLHDQTFPRQDGPDLNAA